MPLSSQNSEDGQQFVQSNFNLQEISFARISVTGETSLNCRNKYIIICLCFDCRLNSFLVNCWLQVSYWINSWRPKTFISVHKGLLTSDLHFWIFPSFHNNVKIHIFHIMGDSVNKYGTPSAEPWAHLFAGYIKHCLIQIKWANTHHNNCFYGSYYNS